MHHHHPTKVPDIKNNIYKYLKENNLDTTYHAELPYLYKVNKLHKYPIGSRFISASSKCSTKPISSLLTTVLSKLLESRSNYCKTIYDATGINLMWIINNNKIFISQLQKITSQQKAKSINTFDFSTLYTNIDLTDLKNRLAQLINDIFTKIPKYLIINTNTKNVRYGNKPIESKNTINLTPEKIIEHLNFLIDNIYTTFNNETYQQIIGIPMGTDCAPLLANLYLHTYEFEFLQNLRNKNPKLAKTFSDTSRYIDDLASINNPEFQKYIKEIYPPTLTLNKENKSPTSATFLDTNINIINQEFHIEVYDKRDEFPFTINSYPHTSSNISEKCAINIYTAQLIRIARICTHPEYFHTRHKTITQKLIQNGFNINRLKNKFKQFTIKHESLLTKYKYHKSHNSKYIKEGFQY